MGKNYVLQALRLMGLEEMLKLSQHLKVKQPSLKKAAGEDLVVWHEDEPEHEAPPEKTELAQVLPFKRTSVKDHEPIKEKVAEEDEANTENKNVIYPSEFLLWQRELAREATPTKTEAAKGYSRSNEMYVVKTQDVNGQEKIRFASTHGVLVNKKQG